MIGDVFVLSLSFAAVCYGINLLATAFVVVRATE